MQKAKKTMPSRTGIPPDAQAEILQKLSAETKITSCEIAEILKKHDDCCNDPQKLKAIQRRIQAQMNGLDVSAGKVHGRVHFLERFAGWVRKERSDGAA